MSTRHVAIHIILLVCLLMQVGAINQSFAGQDLLPQLKFEHVAQSQLEPLGHINDIIKDTEGYMWFAASKGVARYDGRRLMIFTDDLANDSWPDHWVYQLLVAQDGSLWALTRAGPCIFDHVTVSFNCVEGILRTDPHNFFTLFEDSQQRLWLSSDKGVFNVDRTSMSISPVTLPVDRGLVSRIAEDDEGNLWFGYSDAGIAVFSATLAPRHYFSKTLQTLPDDRIRALTFDKEGRLWIGTHNMGIALLEKGASKAETFVHNPNDKSREIWDITEDTRGLIWVGDGIGVHLVNPEDMSVESHHFTKGQPYTPGNYVARTLYTDDRGEVWVGYFPSGVDRVDSQASQFIGYRHDPAYYGSLPDGGILATVETADGNVWVGAGFGLAKFNRGESTFKHFPYEENNPVGPSGSTILDIEEGKEGELWLGIWDRGLNRRDPKTGEFRHYLPEPGNPNSLLGREPWGLLFDSKQRLWVATEQGISRYRPDTNDFQRYWSVDAQGNTRAQLYSRDIYEDNAGNIWVSSFSGLQLLDPDTGEFTAYRHDPNDPTSISSNSVLLVFEDSQQRLWVATDGSGLNLFDRATGQFVRYGKESGLPNLTITNILEDDSGDLWLSTYNGIVRFTPEQGVTRHFTRAHGLPGNLYNGRSGTKLASGELVLGSSEGLVLFNPDQLYAQDAEFSVVFNEFMVMNEPVKIGDGSGILKRDINHVEKVTLNHKQKLFSLSFTGLNFSYPEDIKYRYRLIGFESEWNDIGSGRPVTFTNLDAGTYRFEVNAGTKSQWNESITSLVIEVLPPPWLSWWAKSIYLVLFICLISTIYIGQRFRLVRAARQLKQEQELVFKLREVDKLKDSINRELDQKVEQRTQELEREKARLQKAHNQLAELNQKLESLTITDQLTGLYNRRYLEQTVKKDIAMVNRKIQQGDSSAAVTFILFDIDNFKTVNDTYGHAAGDEVLFQLAKLVNQIVRDSDYIIRWGGEEFMIVMHHGADVNVAAFAERLRHTIHQYSFTISSDITINRSVSIGLAKYPFDQQHPSALGWQQIVALADRALYRSKQSGKNCWTTVDNLHADWTENEIKALTNEQAFEGSIHSGRVALTLHQSLER